MVAFGSILAFPGADDARDVVASRAVALARSEAAALTFVDVLAEDAVEVVAERRADLARLADAARDGRVEASEAVLQGEAAVEVIRMVLREGHDLVITGPGAATGTLIRDCPCPVLVVKPAGFVTPVRLDSAGTAMG